MRAYGRNSVSVLKRAQHCEGHTVSEGHTLVFLWGLDLIFYRITNYLLLKNSTNPCSNSLMVKKV